MDGWIILDLEPLAAARAGLPERVVVPADVDAASAAPADLARYGERFADEIGRAHV